jgi:hypothetical protein
MSMSAPSGLHPSPSMMPVSTSPPTVEQLDAVARAASVLTSDLWYTRLIGAFTVTMGSAALLYLFEPPFVLWSPDDRWIFPSISQERVWSCSVSMGLLSFVLSILRSVPVMTSRSKTS